MSISKDCKNPEDCSVSSDMFDNVTFGWGELDDHGYWEHECHECAREFERKRPEYRGRCIPKPKVKCIDEETETKITNLLQGYHTALDNILYKSIGSSTTQETMGEIDALIATLEGLERK